MPDVIWKGRSDLFTAGVNTTLLEAPDSPQYVFTERASCIQRFKGLHSLCLSSKLYKGTLGSGDLTGFKVSKCTVNRMPRQIGELIIEWESIAGLPVPVDTYSLLPTEFSPRLETHPNYKPLSDADRMKVRTAVDSTYGEPRDKAYAELSTLAKNLADKLIAGRDAFYMPGWTYTWTTHWEDMPTVSDGGFIQTPIGPLAGLLGSDLDWLRKADEHDFDGNWHRLTRSWIALDEWDTDLYPTS